LHTFHDVGAHPWLPPFKVAFDGGNFFRRRKRIQLFQVLRTLSRGVR
jgi:hypothetical protein